MYFLVPYAISGLNAAHKLSKIGLAALSAWQMHNFIRGTNPTTAPSPAAIPVVKPETPSKTAAIQSLATATSNIAKGQDDYKAKLEAELSTLKTSLSQTAATAKAGNQSILNALQQSPLLANQVMSKDTLDNLVNAIENQTIASVAMMGSLEAQLSSVGGALLAISGTLLKISNNYDASTSNTGDVPYINQNDYYKMLASQGLSAEQINDYIGQENSYIQALKNSGVTDYTDIKKAVQDWRTKTIPTNYQDTIADEVAGLTNKGWHAEYTTQTAVNSAGEVVTTTVPKTTTASPSVAVELPNIEAWAAAALPVANAMSPDLVARNLSASVAIKEAQPADYVARELYARMEKTEYAVQETAIKDLDGNVVATAKPMAIQAIKSATDARLRTDMNNYTEPDSDIEDMFDFIDNIDLKELFAFEKKSERLMRLYGEIPPPVTP